MTVTTSIRHSLKAHLVDLLSAAPGLAGVQIAYGFPGDSMERECVYVARVTGTVEILLMQGGRKQRDDQFTITLIIQAGLDGGSEQASEERASEMYAVVENVLADDPSLDDVDGLIDAQIRQVDGPHTMQTMEGALAMFAIDIECHARYQ
jgi:hypothetical protein